MSTRTDIHSPANFKPEDYEYIGSFDQWPTPGAFCNPGTPQVYRTRFGEVEAFTYAHAEYKAGRALIGSEGVHIHHSGDSSECDGQGCDHCGARIRYVSIFRHVPSGKVIATGDICATERFGCDSRREYDIRLLREAAATERERLRAFGTATVFCDANCPELAEWLLSPKANDVHTIFADMARKLVRFGSLSEKQVDFARKLLREYYERQRNGGKTDQQLAIEAERAKAPDCPEGRMTVTGTVVKLDWRETEFGNQLKMVLKADAGFAIWMTAPSSISNGLQKGDKIEVTVTLKRSDRDAKFGFGSRPSKARVLVG